jgi:murein DD-endopeptidase MepM/ murein hydrolase activator NlpD
VAQQLIERAWRWLHATFPDRQVYIRSEGRIQFFTFSATLQATCAGLGLIFLGWVAFASVNVVFKDHIIAAKDHHYHQMQDAYENRVADIQLSYDELNDALLSAEDRFKSTVDQLAAKQRSIAGLIQGKQGPSFSLLSAGRNLKAALADTSRASESANGLGVASDELGADSSPPSRSPGYTPPISSSSLASHGSGSSELGIMPEPVEPQPRTARPAQASMLDNPLLRLAGALLGSGPKPSPVRPAAAPEMSPLAQQTVRALQISKSETGLLAAFDVALSNQIQAATNVFAHLGMNGTIRQRPATDGVGGPLVSLRNVRMDGISDSAFVSTYAQATARVARLEALKSALAHVPLAMPVRGSQFKFSSGFGPRVDPFTGHIAFHSGVDLAGPWGSAVYATAPGVVVWAGAHGGYGNMVEIDHGYGFHTRYGHLSSILVRLGASVQEGTLLGRLGSTGRSTGPHVHYEVWLADSARDPQKYLEMGRRLE